MAQQKRRPKTSARKSAGKASPTEKAAPARKSAVKKLPGTAAAGGNGDDGFASLRKAETNGDNYDISTEDIIARLRKWQKLCSFRLTGADYNQVTLRFDTLPGNLDAFLRDAYDLCPDLVQVDEDLDLDLLKQQLPKTKKLLLWWD